MKDKKQTNYLGIILGIILNILMIITSIMIYNAYVVDPKINQARYRADTDAVPAGNGDIINNNSSTSVPR